MRSILIYVQDLVFYERLGMFKVVIFVDLVVEDEYLDIIDEEKFEN